jgi:hypothetical protein
MIDVKQILLDSCPVIIQNSTSERNPLDMIYKTMNQDIWVHFDSAKFFIFKDNDTVHIPINIMTKTPILRMILWLIESRGMSENIRNAENRILFRVYKGNAKLDSSDNSLRNELWTSLVGNVDGELTYGDVWSYLARKRATLMGTVETMDVADENEEQYQSKIVELLRLESALKHFEALASRSVHSC